VPCIISPATEAKFLVVGGSSGIGLATTKLFASKGAKVVIGDINPPKEDVAGTVFVKTDVREWNNLVNLFGVAQERYSRIDIVFSNAGAYTSLSTENRC